MEDIFGTLGDILRPDNNTNKPITNTDMKTLQKLSCTSWLQGKHSEDIAINTSIPYVHIGEYFWQGDEADAVIDEINYIYNTEDCTPLQAVEKWASNML